MIYFIHNEIFKELSTSGKKQHFLAPTTYLFLLKKQRAKAEACQDKRRYLLELVFSVELM